MYNYPPKVDVEDLKQASAEIKDTGFSIPNAESEIEKMKAKY